MRAAVERHGCMLSGVSRLIYGKPHCAREGVPAQETRLGKKYQIDYLNSHGGLIACEFFVFIDDVKYKPYRWLRGGRKPARMTWGHGPRRPWCGGRRGARDPRRRRPGRRMRMHMWGRGQRRGWWRGWLRRLPTMEKSTAHSNAAEESGTGGRGAGATPPGNSPAARESQAPCGRRLGMR